MGWDFEIPHTSNNELADIEVGSLYKIKQWTPLPTQMGKTAKLASVNQTQMGKTSNLARANQSVKTIERIIIPLRRLTFNMNTGDTELTVLMDNEITVLPGWMIGQNAGLLEKLNK